ncbi:hypothetical protein FRB94_014504 [Tulasnella sp. JGI-2019a]|nr:hypothetical protein FRB94_014504 [Tulasnella sp. JGI-2019a]
MSNDPITLPGRPRTPSPIEHEESTASSSPHTFSSSSAQQSSLADTSGTSSPDVGDRPELELPSSSTSTTPAVSPFPFASVPSSSFTQEKLSLSLNGFRPAPSFSIARAPRYPGWRPPEDGGTSSPIKGRQSSSNTTTTDATPTLSNTPSPRLSNDMQLLPPTQQPPTRFAPSKPLSPNHLARIANALGVQVPTPISTTGRTVALRSTSQGSERRPASANSTNRPITPKVNSATRFLLYVVPPSYLSPDQSGNSNHFRRGALLPLHATLPSQLAAIAREYSLPSTVGLTVFLLDVKHDLFGDGETIGEEWLGPKIGDEAWKLLWAGMLRAEREGFDRSMSFTQPSSSPMLSETSSPIPRLHSQPNLSSSAATDPEASSPGASESSLSPAEGASQLTPGNTNGLRPLYTSTDPSIRAGSPHPTDFSRTDSRTESRTDSRADSRAGSIRTTTTAVSPMLPSLPIVGKIEFDIDQNKATWYEGWTRRPRSRTTEATAPPSIVALGDEKSPVSSPLIPFKLGAVSNSGSNNLAPLSLPGSARITGRRLPPSPLQPIRPNLEVEVEPAQPSSQLGSSPSTHHPSPDPSESQFSAIPDPDPISAGRQSVSSWRDSTTQQLPRHSLLLGTSENGADASEADEEMSSLLMDTPVTELEHEIEGEANEEEEDVFSEVGDEAAAYQRLEDDEDTSFLEDDDNDGHEEASEINADFTEVATPVAMAEDIPLPDDNPAEIPLPEGSDRSLSPTPSTQSVAEATEPVDEDSFQEGDGGFSPTETEGDPLGDVFPSDSETWSEMREEAERSSARSSAHVIHSDRAEFLSGQSSEGSDFTEDLPVLSSTADDFQEVLDMLNAKTTTLSPQPLMDELDDASTGDVSLGDFSGPPISLLEKQPEAPPLTLRSPIILDSPPAQQTRGSLDSLRSPDSETSYESNRSRRPAPLILGPMDRIPSILEGLAPTPPVYINGPTSGTPSPTNPLTPRQRARSTSLTDSQRNRQSDSSTLESVHDEYEDELYMRKELDELEKSISSASPRELAPEPVFEDRERSPIDRPSRLRAKHDSSLSVSLNGLGGPKFRSEALSAERANKIADSKGPPGGAVSDNRPGHTFQWPTAPFDRQVPGSTPQSAGPPSNYARSEETLSRIRSVDEGMRGQSSKYRPPTPGADRGGSISSNPRPAPMPAVKGHASHFSADSAASDDNATSKKPASSFSSITNIRKLWRKSGNAAQASVRFNSVRQATPRAGSPPPPLPKSVTRSAASTAGRPDSQNGRPDSGSDPFHFDQQQQSRQSTSTRGSSPTGSPGKRPASRDTVMLRQQAISSGSKTRSILKGGRTPPLLSDSSSQSSPILEEQEAEHPVRASVFQRTRSNTVNRDSAPMQTSSSKELPALSFQGRHPNLDNGPDEPTIASNGDVIADQQASRYDQWAASSTSNSTLLPMDNVHSSSTFPRTASSRTSFDMEETTFRPSTDSNDPYTPRMSQFEIVSPPAGRSFELEAGDPNLKPARIR